MWMDFDNKKKDSKLDSYTYWQQGRCRIFSIHKGKNTHRHASTFTCTNLLPQYQFRMNPPINLANRVVTASFHSLHWDMSLNRWTDLVISLPCAVSSWNLTFPTPAALRKREDFALVVVQLSTFDVSTWYVKLISLMSHVLIRFRSEFGKLRGFEEVRSKNPIEVTYMLKLYPSFWLPSGGG